MGIKKNWLCAALGILVALSLVGCGSTPQPVGPLEDSSVEKTPEQRVEDNKKIGADSIQLLQLAAPKAGDQIAVIQTSLGTVKIAFFPEAAPKAVENFLSLAQAGYYNGLKFHRIIEHYLIQSGDPTGTGTGGKSSFKDAETGEPVGFENEPSLNLWHFRGALGMASNDDGVNQSQFYIIQNNAVNEELITQMRDAGFPDKVVEHYQSVGGAPWLDGKFTVFGQVLEGMDVVDAIAATASAEPSASSGSEAPAEPVITNITVETYAG